ncbi:Acetylornithine aminotransferase [hydrothermal vent metagenome]|uniref:Acetylornithine aminotransferase n=1 Tax=hydrothermal vent metagenome TaxID=652676 RepID=A0A3B0V222_9ZZZZ
MGNKEIIEMTGKYVAATYGRYPVAFVKGKGARLTDADGKEYLDFVAGLAVCNLGHSHPKLVGAIKKQAESLIHTSNLFHIGPQAELAKLLVGNSFSDRVFFCNSGAEANEAAIKLVRKYFSDRGQRRFQIISMERSFHGRTMAAMAATGQEKIRKGFEPLLEKFAYVPFGSVGAVRKAIGDTTAAVLIEPIQGEGGVNMPPVEYMRELRALCDEKGVLLVLDEVQTGMGRTGKLFAYEHYGIKPDVMTLAKGLAGGVPIGAMLATEEVAGAFGPGAHASTFGGNFLSTAAGVAALRATLEDGVLDNCVKVGEYLTGKLNELKTDYNFITEVRGKGLIIGVAMTIKGADIVAECLARGLIINCAGESVLRFLPPLIITEADVDEMLSILRPVLDGYR